MVLLLYSWNGVTIMAVKKLFIFFWPKPEFMFVQLSHVTVRNIHLFYFIYTQICICILWGVRGPGIYILSSSSIFLQCSSIAKQQYTKNHTWNLSTFCFLSLHFSCFFGFSQKQGYLNGIIAILVPFHYKIINLNLFYLLFRP